MEHLEIQILFPIKIEVIQIHMEQDVQVWKAFLNDGNPCQINVDLHFYHK